MIIIRRALNTINLKKYSITFRAYSMDQKGVDDFFKPYIKNERYNLKVNIKLNSKGHLK